MNPLYSNVMDEPKHRGRPKGTTTKPESLSLGKIVHSTRRRNSSASATRRSTTPGKTRSYSAHSLVDHVHHDSRQSAAATVNMNRPSRNDHYMVGKCYNSHDLGKLGISELPKNGDILDIHTSGTTLNEAICKVRSEIKDIYVHHFGVWLTFGKATKDTKGHVKESAKLIVCDAEIDKKNQKLA